MYVHSMLLLYFDGACTGMRVALCCVFVLTKDFVGLMLHGSAEEERGKPSPVHVYMPLRQQLAVELTRLLFFFFYGVCLFSYCFSLCLVYFFITSVWG